VVQFKLKKKPSHPEGYDGFRLECVAGVRVLEPKLIKDSRNNVGSVGKINKLKTTLLPDNIGNYTKSLRAADLRRIQTSRILRDKDRNERLVDHDKTPIRKDTAKLLCHKLKAAVWLLAVWLL
jgi:hypothetical protein